jgi:hypothetical protein
MADDANGGRQGLLNVNRPSGPSGAVEPIQGSLPMGSSTQGSPAYAGEPWALAVKRFQRRLIHPRRMKIESRPFGVEL